jgi:site-specific recombinase XerC
LTDGGFHLLTVFDKYAKEAQLAPATVKKWRPIMEKIAAEVPDIRNLTRQWCIDWKDRQVARGIAMKSVREAYIASLKAVCEWAVCNSYLAENPALRIKVKVPKTTGRRCR